MWLAAPRPMTQDGCCVTRSHGVQPEMSQLKRPRGKGGATGLPFQKPHDRQYVWAALAKGGMTWTFDADNILECPPFQDKEEKCCDVCGQRCNHLHLGRLPKLDLLRLRTDTAPEGGGAAKGGGGGRGARGAEGEEEVVGGGGGVQALSVASAFSIPLIIELTGLGGLVMS